MVKRILSIALISAAILGNTSCKNDSGFKKLNSIEYKIIKDVPGKNIQIGDVVEYHVLAKVDTLTLADSRKMSAVPAKIQVQESKNPTDFQAVFTKLSVGDSAVVQISCDTIIKTAPPQMLKNMPPWMKKGKKISVTISIISAKSMDEYKKEMESQKSAQAQADDKQIQDYLAKNNIKAQKTSSGLYYTIEKEGTGAPVAKGQTVYMNYVGKTLEGKKFDSNVDDNFKNTREFKFIAGTGQVIPGMDEGAQLLKKGSKATLYIPSTLAYGPQAMGPDLPANSSLIFNVEATDIKATVQEPSAPDAAPTEAK